MDLKNLIFEKSAIATLTVNRPAALNALNREVLDDMARVIREVRHDASVRVLIVTGAGDKAFVAGADIAAMAKMSAVDGLDFSRLGHRVMESFEDLPIPVIAAVNGFALGGGLELALACDLIIASDKARFGQPEINLGLIPGFGGTQRLPHRIGHNKARELIMTGEMFDAKTALELGLANQVVAPDANCSKRLGSWPRKLRENPPSRCAKRKPRCAPHSQWKKMPACASNRRRSASSSAARIESRGRARSSRSARRSGSINRLNPTFNEQRLAIPQGYFHARDLIGVG